MYNPSSILGTDYSSPPKHIQLPDPKDNHMLYATIESNVKHIISNNLQYFPRSIIENYDIELRTADRINSETIEDFPGFAYNAVIELQQQLSNPPISLDDLLRKWETKHKLRATLASIEKY